MTVHDVEDVTAHALGLLDEPERSAVESHLATCAECRLEWAQARETAELLAGLPPETFADGPPAGDLPLRRALRRIREEEEPGAAPARTPTRPRPRFDRGWQRAVAAAAAAFVLLGGGAAVGRLTAPAPAAPTVVVAGRTVEGVAGTVRMSATITPATGWVRVAATVQGIPAGLRCTLLVIGDDGTEGVAGSWLTSKPAVPGRPGTINGSTIVEPSHVSAVAIRTDTGQTIISLPVPGGV